MHFNKISSCATVIFVSVLLNFPLQKYPKWCISLLCRLLTVFPIQLIYLDHTGLDSDNLSETLSLSPTFVRGTRPYESEICLFSVSSPQNKIWQHHPFQSEELWHSLELVVLGAASVWFFSRGAQTNDKALLQSCEVKLLSVHHNRQEQPGAAGQHPRVNMPIISYLQS